MVFAVTMVIILLIDQLSKFFLLNESTLPWWLIDGKVGFDLVMNPGIAFSLPVRGSLSIILSLSVMLILLAIRQYGVHKSFLADLFFGIVIGGALGNLIDRFLHGAVVDFIQVFSFPTFNVADAAISIGFVGMIMFHKRIFR